VEVPPNLDLLAGCEEYQVPSRRAKRFRTIAPTEVGFAGTDVKFSAPLLDFSPFGLSVKTSQEVKVGTVFRLGVKIGSDYFRAAGVVRAKIPEGFAVEFLAMTSTDRALMRRLYLRLEMAARPK